MTAPAARRTEEGQVLPVLLVLFVALAATAIGLFQIGKTAALSSEATSAADAAALAAADDIKGQLHAQVTTLGFADAMQVSLSRARAAADDWAQRNGGRVTDLRIGGFSATGFRVTVEVETLDALDSDADSVDSAGTRAVTDATAELRASFLVPRGVPNLGVSSAAFGSIPGSEWKKFKEEMAGGLDIVALGRLLQLYGYRVSEHPAFDRVDPVHAPNSWHYRNGAVDVNADHFGGGEMAALDEIAGHIRAAGFNVLWRTTGHWDHLHADIGAPGRGIDRAGPGMFGPAAFEVVLVD